MDHFVMGDDPYIGRAAPGAIGAGADADAILAHEKAQEKYLRSCKDHGLAFGIIYTTLDPTNTSLIDHIKEPHEAWHILKTHHARTDLDTLIRLNDKLFNCFMLENKSVAAFCTGLPNTQRELHDAQTLAARAALAALDPVSEIALISS
eukprot:TRINITY_DN12659_c0_g2_i1.p2 TRINITY_DN12659_c0_g2~~TRINITY_DN12659_c0_g2_i1.p2  ORF type:complete len:149 (+),score=13.70 TRINITY_DN12659_c0_g2_i1:179-625(+)